MANSKRKSHLERVIEERRARKLFLGKLFHQRDPLVGVVDGLDPVADPHDEAALAPRLVDELHGDEAGVEGLRKHVGRPVQGPAETVTLGEKKAPRSKRLQSFVSPPLPFLFCFSDEATCATIPRVT